jgi:hypothetical protein
MSFKDFILMGFEKKIETGKFSAIWELKERKILLIKR